MTKTDEKSGDEIKSSIEEDMKETLNKLNEEEPHEDEREPEAESDAEPEVQDADDDGGDSEEDDSAESEDGEESPAEEDDTEESSEESGEEDSEEEDYEEEVVDTKALKDATDTLRNPPQSWTAGGKAIWQRIPRVARAEILKREEDTNNEFKQNEQRIRFASQMERVLQPYQATMNARGVQPEQNIANLLQTQHYLAFGTPDQKKAILMQTAQQFGIDLTDMPEQTPADPQYQHFQMELQQLKQQQQWQQQQQQQQEYQKIDTAINEFENEVDAQGNKIHKYFSNVAEELPYHIEFVKRHNPGIGTREMLEKAYDRAVNANSDTRSAIEAENREKARLESKRRQASAVEAAKKKAAGNVHKKPVDPGDPADKPKGSVRDTMQSKLRELSNA